MAVAPKLKVRGWFLGCGGSGVRIGLDLALLGTLVDVLYCLRPGSAARVDAADFFGFGSSEAGIETAISVTYAPSSQYASLRAGLPTGLKQKRSTSGVGLRTGTKTPAWM